jgi:hypothetical protein
MKAIDVLFLVPPLALIVVFAQLTDHSADAHLANKGLSGIQKLFIIAIFLSGSSVTWYVCRYLESMKRPIIVRWLVRLVIIATPLFALFTLSFITNFWR